MIPQELKNNLYFKKILKYCSLSIKSESEVIDKLAGMGLEEDLKHKILETLKKNKFFFSDSDYIDRFLENLSSTKGYSKIALKQKLLRKGLPQILISSKVDSYFKSNEEDEVVKFVSKNQRKLSLKDKRSQISFLISKGFNYDIVKKVLNEKDL